jgi:hypothetical protein
MKARYRNGVAFMLAAAPGIARPAHYRASPPMAAREVIIVILGCAAILLFGAIVMIIWSRFSAQPSKASPSSHSAKS